MASKWGKKRLCRLMCGKPLKLSIFWLFEATLFPQTSLGWSFQDESMLLTRFLNPFSSSLPSICLCQGKVEMS